MIGERFNAAAAQVGEWLQTFSNVYRLDEAELAQFSVRRIRVAWHLDVTADLGADGQLTILLPSDFPFGLPRIAVEASRYLRWPHVEVDGVLCAFPNVATHSPYDPLGVVQHVLRAAIDLIKDCRAGLLKEDFFTEFHSYWNRERSEDKRDVISLLSKFDSTRFVRFWAGQRFIVIGETDDHVRDWLVRRFSGDKSARTFEAALVVALQRPLSPCEYPRSTFDLLSVVRANASHAESRLQSLVTSSSRPLILFSAPTDNGPALAAVGISTLPPADLRGRRLDRSRNGFRPNKVPPRLVASRILERAGEPNRYEVTRADGAWIHGRGKDLLAQGLFEKKALLLGAGSVGSFVAELLAQAGVGKIVIVDPEKLTFANAGRHLLGADSEGLYKASAVAALLQKRFPHHIITGEVLTAEQYLEMNQDTMTQWDLAIGATGDWGANALLNEVFLSGTSRPRRILIGWAEPHAAAGHAVLLNSRASCLLCGFSADGQPNVKVAKWSRTTLLSEPACGGLYQPYGPAEIATINAMIASLAIEALAGKIEANDVHRVYSTDEQTIHGLDGTLDPEWVNRAGGLPRHLKLTTSIPWVQSEHCPLFGVHNAVGS